MKIESNQHANKILQQEKTENKVNLNDTKPKDKEMAAIYEKSKAEDKGHIYDNITVEELKKDSEKAYATLRQIVDDMLRRQGKSLNILQEHDVVKVDETARIEARELLGPGGALGVEAVSDRIVNFSKAISGKNKSKLDTIKKAIDQGFKEAEKILGELPDISLKTYDRIMEKLDAWEEEEL